MSDQEYGKKIIEKEAFYEFLSAYEHVTGESLELIADGERPDFICRRDDGSYCGLELTQVIRDPDTAFRIAHALVDDVPALQRHSRRAGPAVERRGSGHNRRPDRRSIQWTDRDGRGVGRGTDDSDSLGRRRGQ